MAVVATATESPGEADGAAAVLPGPSAGVVAEPAGASAAVVFAPAVLAAWTRSRWSFFAQPEPLNTIAGVESALRIGDPHRSQAWGPWAVKECITSTGWPQTVHTYS